MTLDQVAGAAFSPSIAHRACVQHPIPLCSWPRGSPAIASAQQLVSNPGRPPRMEGNPDGCLSVQRWLTLPHKLTACSGETRRITGVNIGAETLDALELAGTLFALPSKQRLEDCRKE